MTLQVDLARSGADYLTARAAVLGVRPHDVVRTALREYAERHPLRKDPTP